MLKLSHRPIDLPKQEPQNSKGHIVQHENNPTDSEKQHKRRLAKKNKKQQTKFF